jgi:iron complex outermembrane receptor protein
MPGAGSVTTQTSIQIIACYLYGSATHYRLINDMKLKISIYKILLSVVLLFQGVYLVAQSLSGSVIDSASHQAIEGAAVYIPKLRSGALTDIKGNYKIAPIPKGTYKVEVQMLGYATLTQQVIIKGDARLDFALRISSTSSKEVIITALGNATSQQHAPVPVTVVTHAMFLQQSSTNVIDAIATQPGITAVTTGPGISKPEINGLGYNRVLTLFDGERQEDFQWGDEHGILIDPYAVYDAEIIRGPASLQYGANAVAGVVSLKSQPLAEDGTIQGSVLSEYQTNNGLIGNSVDIGGNHNGFVWDVRGSYEEAHCYSDPHDGYVWGTAFNQGNARVVLKLNRKWGSTRLTASFLHRQIEIPDGNRDSATGQFEFDVPQNAEWVNGQYVPGSGQIFPNRSNFLSYYPDISSYQILNHTALWWQNNINAGKGRIIADIGYTQSTRHEIDTGDIAEENMIVNDIPYSLKYQIEWDNLGLKLTTGFNGMYEFMHNGPEPPSPYIGDFEIPSYHIFDIGGYAILQEDYKNLTVSGGVRYDVRNITGQPMYLANYNEPDQEIVPAGTPGAVAQFLPFDRTFNGFSGSIGASYRLPENFYIKLDLAKSFRAPAINELTSNEVNPGGDLYELGDRNLKPESGYEADVAVGYNGRDFNFEADGFYNYIDNFIFSDRVPDTTLLGKSVFKYQANTAMIAGVAAYFNIHPAVTKWIEIDNGFTYIYSFLPGQTDSTQHVPFTPAPRLTSKVRFKLPTGNSILRSTYIEFGLTHYWAQNNIYSAVWTELPSDAYTLFNAGLGTNFVNPKTNRVVCSLFINCTNLTNLEYVDHTARTQYFWSYNSASNPTNFGVSPAIVKQQSEGIYNMGRNVGFKLIFPIGGGGQI